MSDKYQYIDNTVRYTLISLPPFLSLLFGAAHLTVILVLITERLHGAEATQTVRDAGVLFHVHRQVQEILVFTAHLQHKGGNLQGRADTMIL